MRFHCRASARRFTSPEDSVMSGIALILNAPPRIRDALFVKCLGNLFLVARDARLMTQ